MTDSRHALLGKLEMIADYLNLSDVSLEGYLDALASLEISNTIVEQELQSEKELLTKLKCMEKVNDDTSAISNRLYFESETLHSYRNHSKPSVEKLSTTRAGNIQECESIQVDIDRSGYEEEISHGRLLSQYEGLSDKYHTDAELRKQLDRFMNLPQDINEAKKMLRNKVEELEKQERQFSYSAGQQLQYW